MAVGHECRIPRTPGIYSHPCTHEQGWTQRSFPTPWSLWCPQPLWWHLSLRPHKWNFWNLRLLLPLSKTPTWLLQKVTPGMQEKNIKTPGDLKYPCPLGRVAINTFAPDRSTWSWARSIQPGAHMDTPGMSSSCKWCSPSCHGKVDNMDPEPSHPPSLMWEKGLLGARTFLHGISLPFAC